MHGPIGFGRPIPATPSSGPWQRIINKELGYSGRKKGARTLAGLKKSVIRAGLETLYFSGAHALMQPFVGGVGAILTLHHVRPPRADRFRPNQLLEVTPRFLEGVVKKLRRLQYDLVSLDE